MDTGERIARLPQEPGETWQGAFVRVPSWVAEPGRRPYRPVGFFWVSLETGLVGAAPGGLTEPEKQQPAMALDAFVEFATGSMGGRRPQRVEVRDEALARFLDEALQGTGTQVALRAQLPALDATMSSFYEAIREGKAPVPGYLAGKGVTVERIRSFACAAELFYQAALWRHLSNDDLIRVEAPVRSTAPKYAVVFGIGGIEHGLGFYRSVDGFWAARRDPDRYYQEALDGGMWSFTFCPVTEIPLDDADLWEDEALPIPVQDAFPLAVKIYPTGVRRLTAQALSWLEGLLRALGATREDDLLQGRWTKEVATFDGAVECKLSLPMFLDPPHPTVLFRHGFHDRRAMESTSSQVGRFLAGKDLADLDTVNAALQAEFSGEPSGVRTYAPRTALEKAQDLCYDAFDSIGYRRVVLARRAIETSGDCADAYVLLAEAASSPEERRELYAAGVEAGKRAVGERTFTGDAKDLWGRLEVRPFFRALKGLAGAYGELGRQDEAIDAYRELLRLDPDDKQGSAYGLLPLLLVAGSDEEAEELVMDHGNTDEEFWAYTRALVAFRKHGNGPESQRCLRRAVARNPHVRTYLLDEGLSASLPDDADTEEKEEAFSCARDLQQAWRQTPGAREWLAARGA